MKPIENVAASPAGVSVIICCYNSAARLPETLKHLARQVVPPAIPWEVILVNNASTDDTAKVAVKVWMELGQPANLRVLDEPKPGRSFALDTGYTAAKYDALVTVDDDNWLSEDYLGIASELISRHPQIGVLGGEITTAFEGTPPNWFFRLQSLFAVGPQGKESGDITGYKLHMAGAGMAIRKSVYEELARRNFQFLLSDRKQNQLTSGGDTELCMALVLLGYRIWYDSRLRLVHFMPNARLTRPYLFRLAHGVEASSPVIACYEAAIRGSGHSPLIIYLRGVRTHGKWVLKSMVKFLLARNDWTVCHLELLGFWHALLSLPELLRAFRHHYPGILKLKSGITAK